MNNLITVNVVCVRKCLIHLFQFPEVRQGFPQLLHAFIWCTSGINIILPLCFHFYLQQKMSGTGAIHPRHLQWYLARISPILKASEWSACQRICEHRAAVLHARFNEFRAMFLRGMAVDSQRWEQDYTVERCEKKSVEAAVRRACFDLLSNLKIN